MQAGAGSWAAGQGGKNEGHGLSAGGWEWGGYAGLCSMDILAQRGVGVLCKLALTPGLAKNRCVCPSRCGSAQRSLTHPPAHFQGGHISCDPAQPSCMNRPWEVHTWPNQRGWKCLPPATPAAPGAASLSVLPPTSSPSSSSAPSSSSPPSPSSSSSAASSSSPTSASPSTSSCTSSYSSSSLLLPVAISSSCAQANTSDSVGLGMGCVRSAVGQPLQPPQHAVLHPHGAASMHLGEFRRTQTNA